MIPFIAYAVISLRGLPDTLISLNIFLSLTILLTHQYWQTFRWHNSIQSTVTMSEQIIQKISKSLFIMIRTWILHSADMEKVRICDLQDLNINNLKYQVVDNIIVISFHVWYLALLRVWEF